MSNATKGFATMDKERLRRLAKAGGMAVEPMNRAFSRDRALAAEAGRKGAAARAANRKVAK